MTENIIHDNGTYCFSNHICTECEYEKVRHEEEPCSICIKTPKNERVCRWKPKSKREE